MNKTKTTKNLCFYRKGGAALVVALLMLTVLFVMGVTFISISNRDYIFARQTAMRMQALYLAESGVEYALANRFNWINYPHHEEIEVGEGTITIDVAESGTDSNKRVLITSRGDYGYYQKTITVHFQKDGEIILWEES